MKNSLNPIYQVMVELIYALLLVVYIPLFCLAFSACKIMLFKMKVKRFFGIGIVKESRLTLVSRRSRVKDVAECSTDDVIDFMENRKFAYIKRMSFWTPKQAALTLLGQSKIPLLSDKQLAYIVLHTVYAHSVGWDEEREMFRLYMEGFENLFLFEGFYWDARNILVSPDGEKIVIQMEGGREYHSDCSPDDRPNYELAKLHAQVCLAYFAPGLSHNHVHFVFPSAMAHFTKRVCNVKGTLYNLLSPHFRFTESINHQALRVGKATNNKRGMDRFFFFWQPFPITKEQFLEGVAAKCKKHYVEKGGHKLIKPDISNGPAGNGHSHMGNENAVSHARDHTLFPPDYVTDPQMSKIPYLNFLRQYYKVIENYVKRVEPFVDKKEWEDLQEEVSDFVPRFNKVNFVDGITTFLHQVAVIHYCDHKSYLEHFAYEYGSMSIRYPFEPYDEAEDWKEVSRCTGLKVKDIQKDPTKLIWDRDVMRTRCFLDMFVDYIPNPNVNLQLVDTEYTFDKVGPQMAAEKFIQELRELDNDLQKQNSTVPLFETKDEIVGKNMQLVKLSDIVRTICF